MAEYHLLTKVILILCMYIVNFKTISWLFIKATGASSILLAGFHVIFDAGELWKLLYTIAGVGIPLLLYWLYSNLKDGKSGVTSGRR